MATMPAAETDLFLLTTAQRAALWHDVGAAINDFLDGVGRMASAPTLDVAGMRQRARSFDFVRGLAPSDAVALVMREIAPQQVHVGHPRYFGLFNPAPTTMGIAADALAAAFNPQLAAWSHAPMAVEIEQHVLRALGEKFGLRDADGTFTNGGAEANHTALLCALVARFPAFTEAGLRALPGQPVFYVSAQSHHSFVKAARFCGLGTDAVRSVPVNAVFAMDIESLRIALERDRAAGLLPFMIVATAGTTSGGVIEDIAALGAIARDAGVWFHVDAAWGGMAALAPELRAYLAGVDQADSITFDAHKSMCVPMAAGMLLTPHKSILNETCRITTDYMPRETQDADVIDPYAHSMQWSRRFIGLKVFMSLLVAGWDGYAAMIRHKADMGALLRDLLIARGWRVVNATPLPVVCFTDAAQSAAGQLDVIAQRVVSSGVAWLSMTKLDTRTHVLRACVTHFRTQPDDVLALVDSLDAARQR